VLPPSLPYYLYYYSAPRTDCVSAHMKMTSFPKNAVELRYLICRSLSPPPFFEIKTTAAAAANVLDRRNQIFAGHQCNLLSTSTPTRPPACLPV
jgi:hypothetical protein